MMHLQYSDSLIPVIVQDEGTKEVLMFAYANEMAVTLTRETGYAHYFSRSRRKIWKKGEESGNLQRVVRILVDCDEDCLLYEVVQIGGAACHTGYRTCFYRTIEGNIVSEQVFDPAMVYANKGQ